MSEALKTMPPEAEAVWNACFPVPMETAKDLRESVGNMQILIAQMARLIHDTRKQMEEMQAAQRQVTVTHAEVKRLQAAIREAADEFCRRHFFEDPKDAQAVRADIKKTILSRWQVKDLHDLPQIALGPAGKLIEGYGNIRLVYRLREKHAAGGD